MWTNAFHFAKPKWAREANDWDSELHCADVNSFIVSCQQETMNDRMQSSQYGRQSTHWKILHSTSSKTVVGWWMPCSGQNWKGGVLELAPSYHPRWYGATDRYILEFCMRRNFDKCIWARKNWLLPKIVDIMPVEAHEIFHRELQPFKR